MYLFGLKIEGGVMPSIFNDEDYETDLPPEGEVMPFDDNFFDDPEHPYRKRISELEAECERLVKDQKHAIGLYNDNQKRIGELEAALGKLFNHAKAYQEIDNKIHSRRSDVPWSEVEKDAEVYTWARKDLILTLREIEQALKGDGDEV